MSRAKGILAAVLSLVLTLGVVPVRAAELARGPSVELSAPAPILALPAPLAAPSLSVSAAASVPISAPVLPAALPFAAAVPAPPVAAPGAVAPEDKAFAAQPAPLASAALRAMSAPPLAPVSGRVFDGALAASPASGLEPVRAESAGAALPRLKPSSPAAKARRPRSAAGRLLRAAAAGTAASALAPLLWSALPASAGLIYFAVALSPVAAAAGLLLAFRAARAAVRRLSPAAPPRVPAPPSRRRVGTIRALGFALGVALTAAAAVNQIPLVEGVHAYMDSRLPAADRAFETPISGKYFGAETARALSKTAEGRAALARLRGGDGALRMPAFVVVENRQPGVALQGNVFADSTASLLSRTATGREILDGLRDRGGVPRMPAFFVSYQVGSAAQYMPPDAVFLSVQTIEEGGVTVDRFLRDPRAQLDYLNREQAVIAHELEHADQARRSPFNADTWVLLTTNGARLVSAAEAYASGKTPVLSSSIADGAVSGEKAAPASGEATRAPVLISAAEIHRAGFTVARFVSDPRAQKAYIAAHRAELARALSALPPAVSGPSPAPSSPPALLKAAPAPAAAAAPRAPFRVSFGMIQEWEYEAYITEHFYTQDRLAADPGVALSNAALWDYESGLQDFDAFLRSIDAAGVYAANIHGRSAYYARFMAEQRAGWDAHRVEGYVLLARRDLALKDLPAARAHLEKARAIAAEKGLPSPVLALPAR